MSEEEIFEDVRVTCLKVVQLHNQEQENAPYFRMSEKSLISAIEINSEIEESLLKELRISHERKNLILRSALYGFLKEELLGANCMVSSKDHHLKVPRRYMNNLNILKDDFRDYLDDKILRGRYV